MKQNLNYLSTHFHKVESCTWLRVRQYLTELLIARLQAGRECFTFNLSNFDFETVRDFLEQMDTAYLHPRRDSSHLALCQTMYGNVQITDKMAHEMRSYRLALRENEKKPKSISKAV